MGAAQGRLVLGENVSQAAQFAASGNATAGLFATRSPSRRPSRGRAGSRSCPSPPTRPSGSAWRCVKGAGEEARAFYRYLQGPVARGVFSRYGFALPGP